MSVALTSEDEYSAPKCRSPSAQAATSSIDKALPRAMAAAAARRRASHRWVVTPLTDANAPMPLRTAAVS